MGAHAGRAAAAARLPGARSGAARRSRRRGTTATRAPTRWTGAARRRSGWPPQRRSGAPPGLLRRRRAILTAGLLVLATAIASAIVTLTTGHEASGQSPIGNGVAAIDPAVAGSRPSSRPRQPPSNIAVGEGAVWVLNTEKDTVSRIDPETKSGHPAGFGRPWPGDRHRGRRRRAVARERRWRERQLHAQHLRVDPRTGAVTNTVKLPDRTRSLALATFNWGRPDIVVAAGAVWARNPDHTVSRIDPKTGRLVAMIDIDAGSIAADDEGVWVANGSAVTRIDPRTNSVGRTIRLAVEDASAIAVGAGKVWVVGNRDGAYGRSRPGRSRSRGRLPSASASSTSPSARARCGPATTSTKRSPRIDPRTNGSLASRSAPSRRSRRAPVGHGSAPRARPRAGTLPASVCGDLVSGDREPDVVIASDLPLQGAGRRRPARDGRRDPPRARAPTSRRAGTRSAIARATRRPRRPAASRSAGAQRTRKRTRARTTSRP